MISLYKGLVPITDLPIEGDYAQALQVGLMSLADTFVSLDASIATLDSQAPTYLLLNGSRSMTGNLNLGGHNISNATTINATTINSSSFVGFLSGSGRSTSLGNSILNLPTTLTTLSPFTQTSLLANGQGGSFVQNSTGGNAKYNVQIPSTVHATNITFIACVNPTALTSTPSYLMSRAGVTGGEIEIEWYIYQPSTNVYKMVFQVWTTYAGGYQDTLTYTFTSSPIGSFHMFSATFDGTNMKVYDGSTLLATHTHVHPDPIRVVTGPTYIGSLQGGSGNAVEGFVGTIGPIAFFGTALSQSQITGIYNAAISTGYEAAVLALSPLGEWMMLNAQDGTSNLNDLTVPNLTFTLTNSLIVNGSLVSKNNTLDDGSGNTTITGHLHVASYLTTYHNTLDDGSGNSTFNGQTLLNNDCLVGGDFQTQGSQYTITDGDNTVVLQRTDIELTSEGHAPSITFSVPDDPSYFQHSRIWIKQNFTGSAASGTIIVNINPNDGDYVVITDAGSNSQQFTFRNSPSQPSDVQINNTGSASTTTSNLFNTLIDFYNPPFSITPTYNGSEVTITDNTIGTSGNTAITFSASNSTYATGNVVLSTPSTANDGDTILVPNGISSSVTFTLRNSPVSGTDVLINTSNGSPSQAQGSIYINVAAVDGDWVQITDGLGNSATFTFRNSPLSSTDVQVTGNSSDDVSNLVNTINGSGVIRVNATNFGYVQLSALDAGTKGNVGISVNASQNVYATGNFTVTGQTPNSSNDGDSIVMPDGTTFTMRESPSSGTDVQIVDDDLNTTCNNLAAAMTSNGYTTSFDGTSTFNITAENYGSQYNGTIQYNPFTGGSSDIFNNGSLSGGQIEFTVNGMSGGTNDTTLNLIYAIESNTAATVLSPNGEIQSLTIGAAGNQNIVYTQFNPEGSMNIGTGINGFSGGADEFSITGMAGGYGPGSSPTFTNLILPTNITIAWSSTTGNVDLLEVVWVPDASVYRCIAFYPGYSS